MALTRNEVIDILSAAAAYDSRTVGETNVAAWTKAAELTGWTYDDALDGVHAHYATSTGYLQPAHITAWVRQARRERHERDMAARLTAPAPPAGYRMSPALQAVHDDANVRACVTCRQAVGERCVDSDGRPTRIPHLPRMTGRDGAEIGRRVS